MTKEEYTRHKYDMFNLLIIITELEDNKTDEIKACKRIEKINLPLDCLDALIQYAINHEYSQLYLTALKKKEQLNGFIQEIKENFKL